MRASIEDFALANPIYGNATVTFYTVAAGVKTATKATLYAGITGSTTLRNPQILDSEGKFQQSVYIGVPVIGVVSGLTIADHDTGIVATTPTFRVDESNSKLQYSLDGESTWNDTGDFIFRHRGTWVTATAYARNDTFIYDGLLYVTTIAHTSGTFATDLAASKLAGIVNTSTFIAAGTGAVTRTGQNKMRDVVSVTDYGDGISSDALTKALAAAKAVYIPAHIIVTTTSAVLFGADKILYGPGEIRATSGSTTGSIIVTGGDNSVIDGISFSANNMVIGTSGSARSGLCDFLVAVNTGNNATVMNCTFNGATANGLLAGGGEVINLTVHKNKVSNPTKTSSYTFVFNECISASVTENVFNETTGFGIQFAVVNVGGDFPGGLISKNRFYQTPGVQTWTASGGETSHDFTLDKVAESGVALLSGATAALGVPTSFTVGAHVAGTAVYTINFAAATAGAVYTFKGWRCLENINILGNVTDVTISENIMNGGGDGGIVFGEDTGGTGQPRRISVIANNIKNMSSSGIVQTVSGCTGTFQGNVVTDCGHSQPINAGSPSSNACGISVTSPDLTLGGGNNVVTGNFLCNTVPNFMSAGVVMNGNNNRTSGIIDGGAAQDIIFGNNTFSGTWNPSRKYYATQNSSNYLLGSMTLSDGLEFPYPEQMTVDIESSADSGWFNSTSTSTAVPGNSQYFTYVAGTLNAGGSCGVTRYHTAGPNLLGGLANIMTRSSSYVDIYLATEVTLSGTATGSYRSYFGIDLFKMISKCKVLSGTAYVTVFGKFPDIVTPQPASIYIPASGAMGSAWNDLAFSFPCEGLACINSIRIGQVGVGTAFFQHPYVSAVKMR